jgi:hypothetical protein
MAQICNGLFGTGIGTSFGTGAVTSTVLPVVEELMLRFYPGKLLVEQHDEDIVNSTLWHALLASFQHACTLCIHAALAGDLSHALQPTVGEDIKPELPLLFPQLHMVMLLHGDDEDVLTAVSEAFDVFIDDRNRAGHPVNVDLRDLNRLSWSSRPVISSPLSSSAICLHPGMRQTCFVSARQGQGDVNNGEFLMDLFLLFAVYDFVAFHQQTLQVQDFLQRGTEVLDCVPDSSLCLLLYFFFLHSP